MNKALGIGNVLFMGAALVVMGFVGVELHKLNNPKMPSLPGVTAQEMKSPPVTAGYAKGLEVRSLINVFFGMTWGTASADIRDGADWPSVYKKWSREGQPKRDDPVKDMVERDMSRFMPLDRKPTKEEAHSGFLYLTAFAAAFRAPIQP